VIVKQPRFFSEIPVTGGHVTVAGDEAHHLLHVMRVKTGDRVVLFDGSGFEFDATASNVRRHEVEFRIIDRAAIDRELPFHLTVAVSLPKGDRQKTLIEKLVELGTTEVQPITCQRSVAQPTSSALTRLSRHVIAASKQSGRNRLMGICEPTSFGEWIATSNAAYRWIADPSGQALETPQPIVGSCCMLIGPEGGFSDDELNDALDRGWQAINLGPRILRVETAAVAATAILTHRRQP
jgi:16S rRNA (uracil1498-N3)-methyltransferase